MKKIILLIVSAIMFGNINAQKTGGINPDMLNNIRNSYKKTDNDIAIRNAMGKTSIKTLATNMENMANFDTYFSDKIHSKGITDQHKSGRCWLFTGLNVVRAKMIDEYKLGEMEFSQNYNFFWDQLEKSNLFLQGIIDSRYKSINDKFVEWLLKNPINDGGQFTGVSDVISKYGIVPASVMPETYSSNNTSDLSRLIGLKLKEFALEIRKMANVQKKPLGDIMKRKEDMLSVIYRMLVLSLGEPPVSFTWTMYDNKGEVVSKKEYTPLSFYKEYIGEDLRNDFVMLMNDPSRDYYRVYEIEYDRHTYDGSNWRYVNLPIEDIKKMAISSIKDNAMMYFSCDVGKFLDSKRGVLDVNNYNYDALMGTTFGMDKRERIITFSSGSSHAMTLMAVDLDDSGKPKKWMVENSWGASSGYKGHLIMTDKWFDEYMFRLVVNKKYVTMKVSEVMKQAPILLPPWDPMFAFEE